MSSSSWSSTKISSSSSWSSTNMSSSSSSSTNISSSPSSITIIQQPNPTQSNDYETIHDIFTVTFYGHEILTTVTSSSSIVTNWISETLQIHPQKLTNLLIGLDIEWRPNFQRNVENPVALLQLCINNRCLIFQLIHADHIPKTLFDFLLNPNFNFVGVGIEEDVEKLLLDYELKVEHFTDLRVLVGKELKGAGLRGMANAVLGFDVEKPKRITMSRWDSSWLTVDQVRYACVDAYLSFAIGKKLITGKVKKKTQDSSLVKVGGIQILNG
ncbi:3'-5' exonuclease-like [Tasmannia lanceolata]|uniref:3'-5' exonuclease-like n=1 Tax=Tasmannia lanceolata TaxID=3420 RepID=UPI0040635CE5